MRLRPLHIVLMLALLAALPFPGVAQEGKLAKMGAKSGKRIVTRIMRKGQRSLKRSVRELRKQSKSPIEEQEIRSSFRVLGTEPTWLLGEGGYKNYPFNLLTDLIVGEYDIHLINGGPRNRDAAVNWAANHQVLPMVEEKNPELRLHIALSCYGDFGPVNQQAGFFADFLQSNRLQNSLIDSLRSYYADEEGLLSVGLVIDFENVPTQYGQEFLDFIRKLKDALDASIMLRLPALVNGVDIYTPELLEKLAQLDEDLIDGFIIKGYGYHKPNQLSSTSPLTGEGEHNLTAAINYYQADGKGVPKDKMHIDFANFGVAWSRDRNGGYAPDRLRPYISLDNIPKGADKVSEDGSYTFLFSGDQSRAYTYDSEEVRLSKYRWVEEQGLAGVGVYGLGYNIEGQTFQTVSQQFADSPPQTVYPAVAFLLMFFWVGIAASVIKYWQVRNEIARKRRHQWFYGIGVVLIALVIVFCLWPPIPPGAVAGSSTLLIMFPFLRRIRSMARKWGL